MGYTAGVITVSDKGFIGEREDTSGPALAAMLTEKGYEVVYTTIVPDEMEAIQKALMYCADELELGLVLTTGGTGLAVRDVTPEATLGILDREIPAIPSAMLQGSLAITPKACLSRMKAGSRKQTLIVNLPGSKKGSTENLSFVLDALDHGIQILRSEGSANCGEEKKAVKKVPPSMDQWMKEAKCSPNASKCGMFLTHNGIVRQTAKALVREGNSEAPEVLGMDFSYDEAAVRSIVRETYHMPGIFFIKVWLNEGRLQVGDDIMYVLVGGDIRPHVIDAMQYLVGRIKSECVSEREIIDKD